jgi:hypothetical protein
MPFMGAKEPQVPGPSPGATSQASGRSPGHAHLSQRYLPSFFDTGPDLLVGTAGQWLKPG